MQNTSSKPFPFWLTIAAAAGSIVVTLLGLLPSMLVILTVGGDFASRRPQMLHLFAAQLVAYVPLVGYLMFVVPLLARRSLHDLGFRRPTWTVAGIGLLGALAMLVLVNPSAALFAHFAGQGHEEQAVALMRSLHHRDQILLFIAGGALIAPIAEEIIFRVFLFNALRAWGSFWPAAILSGLLFGAAHFDVVFFFPLALGGVVLAVVYERTRNITAPIITHVVFNAVPMIATFAHFAVKP